MCKLKIGLFNFYNFESQCLDDNKTLDPAILEHIQAIQSLLKKQPGQSTTSISPQVKKSEGVCIL